MKGFESWVNIITLAKDEIVSQRAIIKKLVDVIKAYLFFARGGGNPLEGYENIHKMAEQAMHEAEDLLV